MVSGHCQRRATEQAFEQVELVHQSKKKSRIVFAMMTAATMMTGISHKCSGIIKSKIGFDEPVPRFLAVSGPPAPDEVVSERPRSEKHRITVLGAVKDYALRSVPGEAAMPVQVAFDGRGSGGPSIHADYFRKTMHTFFFVSSLVYSSW